MRRRASSTSTSVGTRTPVTTSVVQTITHSGDRAGRLSWDEGGSWRDGRADLRAMHSGGGEVPAEEWPATMTGLLEANGFDEMRPWRARAESAARARRRRVARACDAMHERRPDFGRNWRTALRSSPSRANSRRAAVEFPCRQWA